MRKTKLFVAAALAVGLCCSSASAQPAPNVIVVLTDDMGPGDFGAFDHTDGLGVTSKVPTPNIDRLAAEGMRFTHAHATSSLCAPTRAGTLAGGNTWRTSLEKGQWGMGPSAFVSGQQTMGDVMQAGGYRTAFLGKQHLGGEFYERGSNNTIGSTWANAGSIDYERPIKNGMLVHGFDYALALQRGIQGGPYFYFEDDKPVQMDAAGHATPITNAAYASQVRQWNQGTYNGGETVISKSDWGSTDWNTMHVPQQMAQNAVDFMRDSVTSHASEPFFMYYASVAAHVPHVPGVNMAVDVNGDGDTADPGETVAIDGYDGTGPAPDDLGTYKMRMINTSDAEVGAMLAYLDQADDPRNPGHKLIDNTVIVFTADNGGLAWDEGATPPEDWTTYGHDPSGGLRDAKGSIYEGGHRVPFVVRWAGQVEAGAARDQLVATHDIMGTLAAMTGQTLVDQALDSYNMMPVLLGEQGDGDPVRDHLIVQHNAGQGTPQGNVLYDGEWKLMVGWSSATNPSIRGLYNLAADPTETNNLQNSADPEVQARLSAMYSEYLVRRNAERSAPVFVVTGDTVDVATAGAYGHVTLAGTLEGSGAIAGDLKTNAGGVVRIGGGSGSGVLQLAPSQDTNIKAGLPDTNYNNQRLAIGTTDSGTGPARALLMFDLANAPIPDGAVVLNAELTLTVQFHQGSGVQSHTMELHRLVEGFVETEATWNHASASTAWTTAGGELGALLETIPNFNTTAYNAGDAFGFDGAVFVADLMANLDNDAYGLLVKLDASAEASGVMGSVWANSNQLGAPKPVLALTLSVPTRLLSVQGDYHQRAGSTLEVDLGAGGGAGVDHDQLVVNGEARLAGGGLAIGFDAGFTPALGDAFVVLTSGGLSGAFDNADVSGATLDATAALAVLYEGDDVRLYATYRGDANGDGAVSLADLNALGVNFGATGATWQQGDFNYDGAVSLVDLNALGVNYGQSVAAAVAQPAVPEPASLVLLGVGLLALSRRTAG